MFISAFNVRCPFSFSGGQGGATPLSSSIELPLPGFRAYDIGYIQGKRGLRTPPGFLWDRHGLRLIIPPPSSILRGEIPTRGRDGTGWPETVFSPRARQYTTRVLDSKELSFFTIVLNAPFGTYPHGCYQTSPPTPSSTPLFSCGSSAGTTYVTGEKPPVVQMIRDYINPRR